MTSSPEGLNAPVSDDPTALRDGYAQVGDVRLHYRRGRRGAAGRPAARLPGVLVRLAAADRAARGGGLPSRRTRPARLQPVIAAGRRRTIRRRPAGADVHGLIRELGAESALLAGHDWGGTAAWTAAMNHPEVVDRLAILNAAHPRRLQQGLRTPGQLRKSWYFFYFQLPGLPERGARSGDWRFFRSFLRDARPPYTPEDMQRYVEAWSQPGAAAGMINDYRAAVRQSPKQAAAQLRPVSAPTLVIWGQRDRFLGPELAEPDRDDVPGLDRVERLPDASHWVHHDESERVAQLLIDFFAPARPTGNGSASTT